MTYNAIERAKEIFDHAAAHGKEAAKEVFGITDETFRRYMRAVKDELGQTLPERPQVLEEIARQYNLDELRAIAKGGRLLPGAGKVPIIDFEGQRIRFGVISDPHIGHMRFVSDRLFQAYEQFRQEMVDFITVPGDVTEGMSHRPGQIYELTHLGYDNQRNYARELFGQWTETPIYAIDGNHDRWYLKSNGALIVKDLAGDLENFHFLGHDEGDISLKGQATLKLWHGEDGNCFDDQTEIMTDRGFIPFKALTKDDLVATMTKDGHLFEWQNPTHITVEDYDGDMLHFESRVVDLMVTPNHGMWTRAYGKSLNRLDKLTMPQKSHRRLDENWHRKTAEDLSKEYRRQKWQFTTRVEGYRGDERVGCVCIPGRESKNPGVKVHHYGEQRVEDVAELIAWYVTEGY